MRTRVCLIALSLLVLPACPVGHQSGPARAQEAATELNVNARFGRMELAAEHVSPKARQAFFERRRAWGGKIRVADYEMAGMKMQGKDDAEMFVRVAWYRVDEGDLRVTTLRQKWHDFKGDWKLTEEMRIDGDVGLLGEAVVTVAPPGGPRNAQFPTVRLGSGDVTVAEPANEEPSPPREAAPAP
jgi:hypothetical protein